MGFLRKLRDARILKHGLLDEEAWFDILHQHPILDRLSDGEKSRLRELCSLFLHEKTIEGVKGFELDDFKKQVIASQACLPILSLDLGWYSEWKWVLVVPKAYTREYVEVDEASVVREYQESTHGDAPPDGYGSVVLSWENVEESGWGDGYNVVIHEAAHILDARDGSMDGRPPLHPGMSPLEWQEVFSRAYEDLRRRMRSRKRGRIRIDEYAAESDSEFFAVASEHFFENPKVLRGEYPDVYRLLAAFYRQDPLSVSSAGA